MGSKGSNTTTTQTGPNPAALNAYYGLLNQAANVAATPYQQYGGQLVAPIDQQQQTGIGTINNYATSAVPYLQTAAGYAQTAAQPLTQAQIQQYQSPYTQDVVNATEAQLNNQNAIQQQQILGNAAAQGALGGDRTAVAQAVLAGQQQAQEAPTIAGLENQGYQTGLQTAEQQQQNMAQGAYNLGNVGTSLENAGLTGANAQVGAGTLEQQTQQAQDTAAYQQFEQALQYPFATTQWLAGIDSGIGSQMGGTSQTTAPAPNQTAQYAGLALGALGLFANRGGRIKRDSGGGLPYGSSGLGWVPTISITGGSGAPKAPNASGQQQASAQNSLSNIVGNSAKGFQGGENLLGKMLPGDPSYGGGNALSGDAWGGSASSPLAGLTAEDYGAADAASMAGDAAVAGDAATAGASSIADILPMLALANRGGRIKRAYGGLALPRHNRIGFKRGGAPIRAGLGMASFVPRRHFDDGGAADDTNTSIVDQRFISPPVPASQYDDYLANKIKFQAYGLNSPYANSDQPAGTQEVPRTQAADDDTLPPQITAPPSGGLGSSALAFSGDNAAAPTSAASAPAPQSAPTEAQRTPHGINFGLGYLSPDAKMALLSAGLGMMASRSPFLGVAIGEGGQQGLATYANEQKQEQDVDLKVKQLNQQAKAEQDRISLEAKRESDLYSKMTPAQQAELQFRERQQQLTELQPVKIGQDIMGRDVLGVRDPKSGHYLDPATMQPIDPARLAGSVAPGQNPTAANSAAGTSTPTEQIGPLPARDEGMAQRIAHYELPPPSGFALARPNSPAAMWLARANEISMTESGEPYDATQYGFRNKAMLAFAPGAKNGEAVKFFNNSVQHLTTLDGLIDAMGNGDVQAVNRLKQMFQNQFGGTAPATFDAAKQIVGQEIVKSIVANGGGEAERQQAAATLAAARSPDQLRSIINAYKELAGAQLRDLKVQYTQGTHNKDFEKRFLIPESQAELAKIEARAPQGGASNNTPPILLPPAGVPAGSVHGTSRTQGAGWQTPDGRFIPDRP